jgi:hypothetical protein
VANLSLVKVMVGFPFKMDSKSELGKMQLFENSWDTGMPKLRLIFGGEGLR